MNNKIKTDTELLAKAFEQKEAGKKDLANFLISRSPKSLQDLIVTTWKMQDAVAQVQRNKTTRMEYTHTYIYTSERFQVELICLLAAPDSKVKMLPIWGLTLSTNTYICTFVVVHNGRTMLPTSFVIHNSD